MKSNLHPYYYSKIQINTNGSTYLANISSLKSKWKNLKGNNSTFDSEISQILKPISNRLNKNDNSKIKINIASNSLLKSLLDFIIKNQGDISKLKTENTQKNLETLRINSIFSLNDITYSKIQDTKHKKKKQFPFYRISFGTWKVTKNTQEKNLLLEESFLEKKNEYFWNWHDHDIFSSSAWTGDKKKNKGDDEINQLSKYQKRYK